MVDNNSNVLANADDIILDLTINCTDGVTCLSPASFESINITNGQGETAQNYSLKSSGYFLITATGDDLVSDSIAFGEVTNLVKEILLEFDPSEFSVFFNTTANVTVIGEDDELFILECNLTILDNQGDQFAEALIQDGKELFVGYVNSTDTKNFTASCNDISKTTSVTVNPLYLKIELSSTVIITQPSTSNDTFQINVYVQDNEGNVETGNYNFGVYEIEISLNSQDSLNSGLVIYDTNSSSAIEDGVITVNTTSGAYESSVFRILSSGNFTFSVRYTGTFPEVADNETAQFEVLNEIKEVTLTLSDSQVSILQTVNFTVQLIGTDDNPYVLDTSIVVNDTNEVIYKYCTPSNGSCVIAYDSDTLGNFSLFAKAESVLSSFEEFIVGRWQLDPLVLTLVIFT